VDSDPYTVGARQWTVVSGEKNGRLRLESDDPSEAQGKQARIGFGIHEAG